jgi:hypothetical protein
MITVYRIEHPETREGPYQNARNREVNHPIRKMRDDHNCCPNHPSGGLDILNGISMKNDLFACPSLRILFRWFKGYLKPVIAEGYQIVAYDCKDKHINWSASGTQVTFNKFFYIRGRVVSLNLSNT